MDDVENKKFLHNKFDQLPQEIIDGSMNVIAGVFKGFREAVLEQAGHVAYDDKADGSPVTATDVEIEEAVKAELSHQFPDLPVLGEESGYDDDHLPPDCWLIDPIDGTKSFVAGESGYTCMAVLIENGESVASLIYDPLGDQLFTAQRGKGAFKDGVRLDFNKTPLAHTLICKEEVAPALSPLAVPLGMSCDTVQRGGGYGLIMVADGRAAARMCIHSKGFTHDYAPGALLVKEAGGEVIPVLEEEYDFKTRTFVACHPALAKPIRENLALLREIENS